jgi:hypothetical protein
LLSFKAVLTVTVAACVALLDSAAVALLPSSFANITGSFFIAGKVVVVVAAVEALAGFKRDRGTAFGGGIRFGRSNSRLEKFGRRARKLFSLMLSKEPMALYKTARDDLLTLPRWEGGVLRALLSVLANELA